MSKRGVGVPMLGMGDLFSNSRASRQSINDRVPLESSDPKLWLLEIGDLLFGRRSLVLAGAGKCVIVKQGAEAQTFESSLIRVRLEPTTGCPDFYFYYFSSRDGRSLMESIVEQVAVAGIRSSDLARLQVPVPPVEEQRRIASVLGALDDLIDTNAQLLQDLREHAAAFLAYVQIGVQRTVPFGDIARLVRVKAKGSAGTPYLGLEHFGEDGAGITDVGRLGDTSSQQQEFEYGDVLYGRLRPYFRKVDRPGFAGACSGEIWVMRPSAGIPAAFLHAVVATPTFTEFAMTGSEGTKMPRAKWDHVARYPVPLPPTGQLDEFASVAELEWEQAVSLREEMNDLRRVRDELLQLLMSGQVYVGGTKELIA